MNRYETPKMRVVLFQTEEVLGGGSDIINLPIIPFSVKSETKNETPDELGHPAN